MEVSDEVVLKKSYTGKIFRVLKILNNRMIVMNGAKPRQIKMSLFTKLSKLERALK